MLILHSVQKRFTHTSRADQPRTHHPCHTLPEVFNPHPWQLFKQLRTTGGAQQEPLGKFGWTLLNFSFLWGLFCISLAVLLGEKPCFIVWNTGNRQQLPLLASLKLWFKSFQIHADRARVNVLCAKQPLNKWLTDKSHRVDWLRFSTPATKCSVLIE